MRVILHTRSYRRLILLLLPFLLTWHLSGPAMANCEASVSLVDFGQLDLDEGANVSGEVVVTCNQPARFNLALSSGLGDYRLRKMLGSDGDELTYNLFVDPARRRVWGDGISGGTQTIKGENDGRRPSIIPIYAFVPPRQSVLTGSYRDNLLVTVENL
jgi:spore coat protein U-like protein